MTDPDETVSVETLPADEASLVRAALYARARAYAPWSHYQVGCAVVTEAGTVHSGSNVENASFGLTVCAERVAIWRAVAGGSRRVTQLAVASGPGASMCGACRQVLAEFAAPETLVLLSDAHGRVRRRTLAQLLPEAFTGPHNP